MPLHNYNASGDQQHDYTYVDGPANVVEIFQAAGLDPVVYASADFLTRQGGLFALMELFSDGEQRFGGMQQTADPYAVLTGSPEERHGDFYEKMAALRRDALSKGGPMEDEVHRLERFTGHYFAGLIADGEAHLPKQGAHMVRPSLDPVTGNVTVDCLNYTWAANHEPAVILDYGPGVEGVRWFDPLIRGLASGRLPFQYIGVTNGPFVGQFLVDTLGRRLETQLGPGAGRLANTGQLFISREDGMERATRELLATPQPNGTHELCDLMLFTALHMADPGELERTIMLSPQLLKADGRIMLSAPLAEVEPGMTTFAQEVAWALQAGYALEWEGQANTGDTKLGTGTVSGFAVFRKALPLSENNA